MAANGVNVSRDLLWLLTKDNNCHLMKRRAIPKRFTTDPLNPKGIQSLRFSGSVQKKALTVEPHKSGKGVNLLFRKRRHQNRPQKTFAKIAITKNPRATLTTIRKFSNKNFYRLDLKTACLRRASAILKSQQPRKPRKKELRRGARAAPMA